MNIDNGIVCKRKKVKNEFTKQKRIYIRIMRILMELMAWLFSSITDKNRKSEALFRSKASQITRKTGLFK